MLKWTCCVAHSNKWRYLHDLFKNGQKFKRISLFDENYIDVATNHQVLFFFFSESTNQSYEVNISNFYLLYVMQVMSIMQIRYVFATIIQNI